MIPADHIIIDGGTALVVTDRLIQMGVADWVLNNRPCDACDGGAFDIDPRFNNGVCPDCDGSKRHTFTVDTYCEQQCDVYPCKWTHNSTCSGGVRTLTVHVIDVLPIVDEQDILNGLSVPASHVISRMASGEAWLVSGTDPIQRITLPPAAKPGMRAVRVRIVSGD